jgi:formylglycine-generating enzyme required for sulfatase activity
VTAAAAVSAAVSVSVPATAATSGTDDVLFGLDGASPSAWQDWFSALSALPSPARYSSDTDWSDSQFRQYFLFLYDQRFLSHGSYHTAELLESLQASFGRVDSVQLWHAYPQLGFDSRSQFDFYRELPGGLAGVRRGVSDVLHARGVRVFVDYNPWDDGANVQELAEVVAGVDADGVFLDTMSEAPAELVSAVLARRPGTVFTPEDRPEAPARATARQSWAQWSDLGGDDTPSIYRLPWETPGHRVFTIRRWDTDRAAEIAYAFFNGQGEILWDNVFSTWNPYSAADRRLLATTGRLQDAYGEFFSRGKLTPLVPTGVAGLDANRWELDGRVAYTARNRTAGAIAWSPPAEGGKSWRALLGASIAAGGTELFVQADDPAFETALARVRAADSEAALEPSPGFYAPTPAPRLQPAPAVAAAPLSAGFARIPGGHFSQTITHPRRETGCYSDGADADALWGWNYTDTLTHRFERDLPAFAMRVTAVTNAEFAEFVLKSGYRPRDPERFLAQLPRAPGGALAPVPAALAGLPVTYVSLDDARAYARFKGERLPTEAEWQWAAEGAGAARAWPWGSSDPDAKVANLTGALAPASAYPAGASAQGVLQLTGNAWEWTESQYDDGHTRFAMLRGGSYLPARPGADWLPLRGPRPSSFHVKYLLSTDAIDRSEAISFRTIRPL